MEMSSSPISTEEQDCIDRSTKKLKHLDKATEIQMADAHSDLPTPTEISYRDKLLRDSFDGPGKSISQTPITFNLEPEIQNKYK